jgi:DNA gyrase inhibitor GyrI
LIEELTKMAKPEGFTQNITDMIDEQFGIFYDNPEQLEDESFSRAIYGLIIPDTLPTAE